MSWLGPGSPVRTLTDIIAFNNAHREQELKYFGQELLEMADAKGPLTSEAYLKALATNRRQAGALGIDMVMTKHQLDALVAPTFGLPWLTDLVAGDVFPGGASSPSIGRGGRRLPAHHRADGIFPRPAARLVDLRPRLERTDAPQDRVRLRTGDEAPAAAHVRADGGPPER